MYLEDIPIAWHIDRIYWYW